MARRTSITAIALLTVACGAQFALAAGGGDDHGEKPALLGWDYLAAFWSIAVFVVLLLILRVAAWKPILNGLNQREEFIKNSLENAKREREEAEKLLAQYTEQVEKAREEATAIVEEGRRDAEETRKRLNGEAKAEAEAVVARAKNDITLARDDAVKQLHDQTILLATQVAAKMIRKELSPSDHQALLTESLAELSQMEQ